MKEKHHGQRQAVQESYALKKPVATSTALRSRQYTLFLFAGFVYFALHTDTRYRT